MLNELSNNLFGKKTIKTLCLRNQYYKLINKIFKMYIKIFENFYTVIHIKDWIYEYPINLNRN